MSRFYSYFVSVHKRRDSSDEWSARRKASPWMQDNTNTEKRTHTPNIYALNGIRTNDQSVRGREDSSFLRPLGYRDR
jgi:hypothetical protein